MIGWLILGFVAGAIISGLWGLIRMEEVMEDIERLEADKKFWLEASRKYRELIDDYQELVEDFQEQILKDAVRNPADLEFSTLPLVFGGPNGYFIFRN